MTRENRVGGRIALKLFNKNARLSRSEILSICEELEDIVRTDVVALRAEAGLPVAADKARR